MSLSSNNKISRLLQIALSNHSAGRLNEASQLYHEILSLDKNHDEALHLLGIIAAQTGDYEQSILKITSAISINPTHAPYYCNIGNAYFSVKNYEVALSYYDQAIRLKHNYAEAYSNRGNALKEIRRLELAIQSYDKAIILNPQYADAYYNKGITLYEMMKTKEAIDAFKMTICLDAQNEEAFYNLGVAQHQFGEFENAIISYTRAISLRINYIESYCGRGHAFRALKRFAESAADFKKAIEIDPKYEFVKGYLLHSQALSCDWQGMPELIEQICQEISAGAKVIDPFSWQAVTHSIDSLMRCSKIYAASKHPSCQSFSHSLTKTDSSKIKIGYVSGEIGDEATSHLLVGVLEKHNKDRFEVLCFDNGYNDRSDLRRRIENSVKNVFPITNLDDNEASKLINTQKVDILINLNGYFGHQRNNIFSKRPSPIQVNFLGFPGTLAADYIDYIIADKIVLPVEEQIFYFEKVIYMPHSYQPNDRDRIIGEDSGPRSKHGLPPDKFVFCCFNNSYKITQDVFDVWMNILKSIKNSVLWLLEDSPITSSNLKNQAYIRKVDPMRLIFAPRVGYKDHLARHKFADLFLDTLPCNAHTTASDALWAGLPILTCSGKTFPGRVTHSLLSAIRLPELVTHTLDEYQNRAIELASDSTQLVALKDMLKTSVVDAPLFNTESYTLALEESFEKIYARYYQGLASDHVYIDA